WTQLSSSSATPSPRQSSSSNRLSPARHQRQGTGTTSDARYGAIPSTQPDSDLLVNENEVRSSSSSLAEIEESSLEWESLQPGKQPSSAKVKFFRDCLRFIGPGFMVGVGYLDPGNWATDLSAGSTFGYDLLYVVFTANLMAIVLQYLCIKVGVVTGRDLAMACRRYLPPSVNIAFFILCELAIIATDLAEVIGTAIALNLLFQIPLPVGVALTGLDVLMVLALWETKNLRVFETAVMGLVVLVAGCFVFLLTVSQPDWGEVMVGFIPPLKIFKEDQMLYLAMGIIGATIMPHNLYLHSSIVRYRANKNATEIGKIEDLADSVTDLHGETPILDVNMSIEAQPAKRKELIPLTLWYSNMDSVVALCGALLVNCSILIVAAKAFNKSGDGQVAELKDAYLLLSKHLGKAAGIAFAVALLCAGQSSTITGTLAGQIVTEGFLGSSYKLSPWFQRLITRVLAIAPAMTVAILSGESGMNSLLVLSQVVLSLQLPFAIWPLIWITSDSLKMKVRFLSESEVDEEIEAKPGMFDLQGKAKWDAWTANKGMRKEDAQAKYIDTVKQLQAKQ
ncbi:hypothetical protein HDU76_001124, partial [Blyttiomyces sp. JEL0837]